MEPRWRQRLDSLERALRQPQAALDAHAADPANAVIGLAVIKATVFSFELGWKTLKDLLSDEGIHAPLPRLGIREPFVANLVRDGQIWIAMLKQQHLVTHSYAIARALQELARDLEHRP